MTRSLAQPAHELKRLNDVLTAHKAEIRNLKLAQQKIATPQGVRNTQNVGVLPPSAGGTGTTEDIKGSVTIWTEAERDRHTRLTRIDEREECAMFVEALAQHPDLADAASAIAKLIRER